MVAGPTVFICDGCIEISAEIVRMVKTNPGETEYQSWFAEP